MDIEKKEKPRLVNEFLKMRQRVGELETFMAESMQTEECLRKFSQLFSEIDDLAYFCDTGGAIIYVNQAVKKLTGYNPEEFINKPFAPFFEGEELAKATRIYTAALRGESAKGEISFKNSGVTCEYRSFPMRNENGEIIGVMGIARDISERKRLEENLNLYLGRLEEVLNENSEEIKKLGERLNTEALERRRAEEQLKEFKKNYNLLFKAVIGAGPKADLNPSDVKEI